MILPSDYLSTDEIMDMITTTRKNKNISPKKLAYLSGVKEATIRRLELRLVPNPGIQTIQPLLGALGIRLILKY